MANLRREEGDWTSSFIVKNIVKWYTKVIKQMYIMQIILNFRREEGDLTFSFIVKNKVKWYAKVIKQMYFIHILLCIYSVALII